jgi:DNA-binding NtrC family response regulator
MDAAAAAAADKYSVLVVDDEPDMLFSLRGLLRREFKVFTAGSGREAIEILRQHPVHVILTDQRMPEMTGVEFLSHARAWHPDAIRVIFTGYADTRSLVEAINQANVYRFVAKPWDPEELIALLRAACEAYQRIVERKRRVGEMEAVRGRLLAGGAGEGDACAEAAGVLGRAVGMLSVGQEPLV